ncbi:hypothetical protein EV188_10747 [Actinomycetospora succinea]|uniref:Excreted virulence factor EspC (Type VII ESX diderm) n=1 Tax=Actinomycetospora succinea TaxID=663603 RepID=A0A4V3D8R1_9PSEU|nr:hypothetical protein [Actinomycetospora succinea]TDQ52671.1 hypothetical protein EV188_10747 [Actinomycetospora succinea]
MPDLVLGPAALEQARAGVAAEARRVPAMIDRVTVPRSGLGDLASAGAMMGALDELRRALDAELGAAGSRLDGLDRALDAALTAVQATDRDAAASLAA